MPVLEMSDKELAEARAERDREFQQRMKWARAAAKRFEGLSFEAVLLGFREHALVRFEDVIRTARFAQLDIDDAAAEKDLWVARIGEKRAFDAYYQMDLLKANPVEIARAWKRKNAARAAMDRLENEQDRLWKKREALWAETEGKTR